MNTSKLAEIGEVISSIAIVITLIVLIIEVRGNTEAIKVQTVNNQIETEGVRRGWLFLNEGGIGDLVFKGRAEEFLSEAERWRLDRYYTELFEIFEWQYGEVEAGRLPEELLNVGNWRAMWRTQPILVESFERTKANKSTAFVKYWEGNVINR